MGAVRCERRADKMTRGLIVKTPANGRQQTETTRNKTGKSSYNLQCVLDGFGRHHAETASFQLHGYVNTPELQLLITRVNQERNVTVTEVHSERKQWSKEIQNILTATL